MVTEKKLMLWGVFSKCTFIQQYKDNIDNPNIESGRADNVHIPYKDIMNTYDSDQWLKFAFKWSETPQGVYYWRNIDKKWRAFLNHLDCMEIVDFYLAPEKEKYLNILQQCSFFPSLMKYVENEETLRLKVVANPIEAWIGSLFEWEATSEGKDFWDEVSGCWERYYNTGDEDWMERWLNTKKTTAESHGAEFSVVIPKSKGITLNFKI